MLLLYHLYTLIHTKIILVIFVSEQSDSARLLGHFRYIQDTSDGVDTSTKTALGPPVTLWFVTFSVANRSVLPVTSRRQKRS